MRLQGTEFNIMHSQQFGCGRDRVLHGSLENASLFWRNTDFGLRTRELERGNFNHIWELSTISSWTLFSSFEEVAQRTVSARLPRHSFAQQSRTQCSVPRIRPLTHVFWYLVQLTFLRATISFAVTYFLGASRSSAALIVTATVKW